ncbi:MAG: hypothetical protein KDE21_00815 [Novosphingobium sp.]|nr:hypothetical protein [Novosphingobium sp.]
MRRQLLQVPLSVQIDCKPDFAAFEDAIKSSSEALDYEPPGGATEERVAESVVRLAIALQLLTWISVSRRYKLQRLPSNAEGKQRFLVVLGCFYHEPAQMALEWAVTAFNHFASPGQRASDEGVFDESVFEISKTLRPYAETDVNTKNFLLAADELDIPAARWLGDVYRYGTGSRARLLKSTITDRTPAFGQHFSTSKYVAASILRGHGLPGSEQRLVDSEQDAIAAAEHFGYPVVVKPPDRDLGVGVAADLRNREELLSAFADAQEFGRHVIVERHFEGEEFRLTVIAGKVVKIENRVAAGVEGDGISTVRQLVDRQRATPKQRRVERVNGKVYYQLDAEALLMLDRIGLTPESVPAIGQRVTLKRRRNANAGADQIRVDPKDVHPDNMALAIRAAEIMHLDFAGVDFLSPDITRSWRETGALICEVNIRPGIGSYTSPRIYVEILERMFAEGSRIPAYLLLTDGEVPLNTTSAQSLYDKLGCNGLSCAGTILIDGKALPDRPGNSFSAAQILLGETRVDSALCVMSAQLVAKKGLPNDWFDAIFVERPGPFTDRLIPLISPNAGRVQAVASGA